MTSCNYFPENGCCLIHTQYSLGFPQYKRGPDCRGNPEQQEASPCYGQHKKPLDSKIKYLKA